MDKFEKYEDIFIKMFDFIKNDKTREYCISHLSYCFYLHEECKIEQDKKVTEYKTHTIGIYLWSIIESVSHYFVAEFFKKEPKKLEKYLLNKEFKVKDTVNVDWKQYYFCSKEDKIVKFSENINFNQVIHWLRNSKIFSEKIIKKIDEMRNIRNTIHIVLYEKDFVSFKEVKNYLRDTLTIVNEIKEKLW